MREELLVEAEKAVRYLTDNNMTVAAAESCTGGLISEALTEIPGASAVIGLGICSYSAEMKHKILGVSEETIGEFGTVSRQTAAEMACGVRKISGADIGISVTGAAGPQPSEGKVPGTVFIGISDMDGTKVRQLRLEGLNRGQVRERAACEALRMLIDRIPVKE